MVKFDDDLLENLLARKTVNNENEGLSVEFKKWQERPSKSGLQYSAGKKIHHLLRYFRPELCLPSTEAARENTGAAAVKYQEIYNFYQSTPKLVLADCKYIFPNKSKCYHG